MYRPNPMDPKKALEAMRKELEGMGRFIKTLHDEQKDTCHRLLKESFDDNFCGICGERLSGPINWAEDGA